MRLVWLLLALPSAAASPLLVAVAPDLPGTGPGDEGLAIGGEPGFDLDGWTLTDGEGVVALPSGTTIPAAGELWLTGNLSSWSAHDGPNALGWSSWSDGKFLLANDGDGIQLRAPSGAIVDAFAWGDNVVEGMSGAVSHASPGLVYERLGTVGAWTDTDRAEDWITPRAHRIGESDLDRPTWDVAQVTLYASPDSSFDVLSSLIGGARQRLHVHVYEFTSAALADRIVAAKRDHPSLDIAVAVQQSPVGFTTPERHATADALLRIAQAGGTVSLLGAGRYDDHHLKVLVADDAVAVQSENWVPTGVPEDSSWGNRGWGAVLWDKRAADWFDAWMTADRAAWDSVPFSLHDFDPLFSAPARAPARSGGYGPIVSPKVIGPAHVMPVIAPDHTANPATDPVCQLVASAKRAIDAEQLDLSVAARNPLGWRQEDCLLSGLARAANAGVAVRVLGAQPFSADDAGVADALAWLAAHAPSVHSAQLDRPGIATLHNKGLVVDDTVVVGSMNGNHHSRSANREADLIIESPEAAAYFRSLFEGDWAGTSEQPRHVRTPMDDLRGIPAPVPTLFVAALVAWVSRRR